MKTPSSTPAARRALLFTIGCAVVLTSSAAEARKKKPLPPPPPPPPPVIVIPPPPRPTPPNGASAAVVVPPIGADGLFQSVNRKITPAQTLWNFRAAYNVAALNCRDPKYDPIVIGYRAFLKKYAKGLVLANRKVDAEFRAQYGARFIPSREKYMTAVYNHFAAPPVQPQFCDAVMAVNKDVATLKLAGLTDFAQRNLPNIEIVFDEFYRQFAKYQADAAAWDARYGPAATASVATTGSNPASSTAGAPSGQ
jgi:hypothetical protein